MRFTTAFPAIMMLTFSLAGGETAIALRRTFRSECEINPGSVRNYLSDKDPEIRRYALYLTFKAEGIKALPALETGVHDPDASVRMTAVAALGALAGQKSEAANKLLTEVASTESNNDIRSMVVKYSWPFHRETKLLREDPSWDYEVITVKTFPIPDAGWKMISDPRSEGHLKKWFLENFDDSSWKPVKIGNWETQGFPDYDGVAWYRIKFTMPPKMDCNSVELRFEAVDESAWIWLNGVYLGCHDVGQEGWNKTFSVDCRREIRWNAENTLVVRVLDIAQGGGIWKPVHVDILK